MSIIAPFQLPQATIGEITPGRPIPHSGSLSARFTVYNHAKHMARRTGILDPRRVDRALGILMSPGRLAAKVGEYGTTPFWCGCPDYRYRRVLCKHVLARMVQDQADALMDDFRQRGELGSRKRIESQAEAATDPGPGIGLEGSTKTSTAHTFARVHRPLRRK